MYKRFGLFCGTLFFMEWIYHFMAFGFTGMNLLLMIPAVLLLAVIETSIVGIAKNKKVNKIILWVIMAINYLLYASQIVYYGIFQKPLLLAVAVENGADAITDFWQVAIDGIVKCIPFLLLLAIPLVLTGVLLKFKKFYCRKNRKAEWGILAGGGIVAIALSAVVLMVGYAKEYEYYEIYQEMYDPDLVARQDGIIALFGRQFMGDILPGKELSVDAFPQMPQNPQKPQSPQGTESGSEIVGEGTEGTEGTESTAPEGPGYDTSPNILNIDFDALLASKDKDIVKMAQLMQNMTPTNKNQYTGMFEGYNLIYITAEAFAPYAVVEELMPTLHKMLNSGVRVEDYYIPLWGTSTSDGEYINLTGQIPDQQHSMKRTHVNSQPYSLPAYFAAEGVKSYAYHNNSLSYYDRHLSHPNLGYDFKAARLGSLSAAEWGSQIFEMKNAKYWPASDYEMMVSTIPEWINEERFHAYYMTVSGHCNYDFSGNMMAYQNRDIVADMDLPEQMKAYIACNYELEKAMTYLVEELEKAGKLANTVIVLSADHCAYGLSTESIEAFLGEKVDELSIYQNGCIIWNSEMETIQVDKTCSPIDLLPTVLNLFGFDYDSRLFPGNDMLSEAPSLVVFSDRSFITDDVIYNASKKKITSRDGAEISEEYISSMRSYVRALFQYSAGILNDDFFKYVHEAEITQ